MPTFISWIRKDNGEVLFLTDKEIFSRLGEEKLQGDIRNFLLSQRAIRAFFGKEAYGRPFLETKFWNKDRYPAEIAEHLKSPKTLLDTWGQTIKLGLPPEEAYNILRNAPEEWRNGLFEVLLEVIAQNARIARTALCAEGLSGQQRTALIETISKNPSEAHFTLVIDQEKHPPRLGGRNLSEKQKDILVAGVAKDAGLAHYAFHTWPLKNINKKQMAVLRNSYFEDLARTL
jgi:hypothetical protein